ncbi:hypothetical protein ACQP1O_43185 (plasmid) [Nocardia sp. CA-151230]|uniref:hypothetical protein n=1 Tax=Nocardia sp. CA-151230 TaxID=3239982 RepID=UPI003D8F484C
MTAPASTQDRRQQAATAAAALYVASRTPRDVATATGHIVAGAASMVANSSAVTAAMIKNLWRTTNPYDDAQVAAFLAKSGQVIVAAQKSVAATTTAAQVAQLRTMGITADVSVQIPDNVRGAHVKLGADEVTVTHKPSTVLTYQPKPNETQQQTITAADSEPGRVFSRAVVQFRYHQSVGADEATANQAAEQRIDDLVDTNLVLAQRLAEQESLKQAQAQDSRITGYRRVIHPELSKGGVCGMCVVASHRVYKISDLKAIHYRCHCTVVAVTEAHDPGSVINDKDLQRLYNDAGEKVGGSSTHRKDLKATRYDIVHHDELGPVLTRVTGEKVPYYSVTPPTPINAVVSASEKPAAAATSAEEFAAHQVEVLTESLKSLRARGFAEDSSPVQYHLAQIAKFRKQLDQAA